MKQITAALSATLTAARQARRRQIIHQQFGPGMNRGPLGATIAFESDGDTEFEKKVLGGVEALTKGQAETKTKTEKLLTDVSRLDGDTKKALEELTAVKRTINDQQANFELFTRKMAEVQRKLATEARASFGDPVARVAADEEMRKRFNAAVRLAISKPGDHLEKAGNAILKDLISAKALGEDASPGSLLLQDQLMTEMYDLLADYGVWNTVSVVPVSTKNNIFPVDTADPVANFILTEADTITDDSNITGTTVTATAEVVAILLNVSLQLIEDSEYDIVSWIMPKFARAYAKRLDYATFRGDGTADATNGGMTGVFNAGTAVTAAAGRVTVETTKITDWMNCILTAPEALFARSPRWWMHPYIVARAALIRDENGRPIFQTALEVPNPSTIGSILGRPVTLGNIMPSTNAASAKIAAYGDPAGQVNGVRKGYTFESSDHHKWNTLQRSFRAHGRFATKNRAATAFSILTLPAA